MTKIQIGKSLTGDLQKNRWTFEMEEDLWAKAGRFAIIDISKLSITQHQELEEFINNL
ncbi:hypothetical protein [Tenacibaculum sp. 190524A02b]|uniref:hypothetical protein n=1 Tax=Tenacibaculum vairaonense TaxID=3137860 RepID=UPI0031FAB20D